MLRTVNDIISMNPLRLPAKLQLPVFRRLKEFWPTHNMAVQIQ
jgi:hypothetical protein